MTATELLSLEALAALRTERPAVPKPPVVRYPWHRWARAPYRVELAEEGRDFWVSTDAFTSALAMHARRHGLEVQTATFMVEDRSAVLFRFSNHEGA